MTASTNKRNHCTEIIRHPVHPHFLERHGRSHIVANMFVSSRIQLPLKPSRSPRSLPTHHALQLIDRQIVCPSLASLTLDMLRRHGRRKAPKNTPHRSSHASRQQLLPGYYGGGADVDDCHENECRVITTTTTTTSRTRDDGGGTCTAERESAYFVNIGEGRGRNDMNSSYAGNEDDDATSANGGPAPEEEEANNVKRPTGNGSYCGGGDDAVLNPQRKRNHESSQGDRKPSTATAAAVYSGRRKRELAPTTDNTERPRTAPATDHGTGVGSIDIRRNVVGPTANLAITNTHRGKYAEGMTREGQRRACEPGGQRQDEDNDETSGFLLSSSPGSSSSPAAGLVLADIELVNLHNLSLHKLEGMERLTRLRVADLSGNELHDTTPLRCCECLEVRSAGARRGGGVRTCK